MTEVITAIVTTLGVVLAGYLTYLGIRHTTKASREANRDTVTTTEQANAVKAYESMTMNLLQPYVDETARLRKRVSDMETSREEERREYDRARAAERRERETKANEIQDQITRQTERIDLLTVEVRHWKAMAKAIARWATTLRDQVISLGGSVPSIPDELLVAQLLDERDEDGL